VTDFLHEEHKGLLVGQVGGARYERADPSENDVCIPPAFVITDSEGGMWTFGNEYAWRDGQMEFNVMRNDVDMDETASRIVMKRGVVWIYGHGYGRKQFSRSRKAFI
jgi:hypothetical protein